MHKSKRLVLALLVAMLALSACGKNNPVAPQNVPSKGKLRFAMDLSGSATNNIASGSVTITKDAVTQTQTVVIANHTGSVTFADIQVGQWTTTVQLFDAAGAAIYSGAGTAAVSLAQTTTLNVQVSPNTGTLIITVAVPNPVIDNFDNDGSYLSVPGQRDANWWVIGTSYTLAMDAGVGGNTTPAMKVTYHKTAGYEWDFIAAGSLNADGKFHDFSQVHSVSVRVYTPIALGVLLKFQDALGRDSSDVSIQTAASTNGWTTLTWDLTNVNWGNCDKTQINNMLLFIQPGLIIDGYLELDDLVAN